MDKLAQVMELASVDPRSVSSLYVKDYWSEIELKCDRDVSPSWAELVKQNKANLALQACNREQQAKIDNMHEAIERLEKVHEQWRQTCVEG